MLNDARIALRTLGKSPGFALTSVAALAIGVGANTAIFSLVNQLLLHPPGISDPERVVAARVRYDKLNLKSIPMSAPDFADIRDAKDVFERAAISRGGDFNYTGGGTPERLQGASVSVEWFDVFGARPVLGRTFRPEEDLPNAAPVVVLAHATWMRLFGGDGRVLDGTVELNQKPYRIIGVMDPEFVRPSQAALWTPIALPADSFTENNRFSESLFTVARLRQGISIERANAVMQVLSDRVRNDGTRAGAYAQSSQWGMFVAPFLDLAAGETKRSTLILLGAVGFVLLIACSNIAGLMVARISSRSREIAVRVALGAGRRKLLSQILAESLLLAAGGAIAGAGVAYAGMRALLAMAPETSVVGLAARLDVYALLFCAATAIAAGIVFGLAPAWQISRIAPYEVLKASGRTPASGHGRQRLRAALVIGESALAVLLLAGAGLFLRSLSRLQEVRPGFEPGGVIAARLTLPRPRYAAPESQAAFYRAVLERLAGRPGVQAAAAGGPLPFSGDDASASFNIEGRNLPPGDPGPHGNIRVVTPEYFEALGIPLRAGRVFTDRDRQESEPVVVIDENLARQYWPGEDPVGKRIRRGSRAPWAEIVGVVGHVNHSDLAQDTGKGVYYFPLFQTPNPFAALAVKTRGIDPAGLASTIREVVREVDPAQPVYRVSTMRAMVESSLAARRLLARLLAFFAAVALFLAALGLYGVVSYSVTQRAQEIGVRMALGAQPASVLALVVGQGLRLALIGAGAGLILAVIGGRLVRNQLYGVGPTDALTLVVIVIALLGAAGLASYIPARRASRMDPLEALRCE